MSRRRYGKVLETLGKFEVTDGLGRAWLYHNGENIARCISGDYVKQHGSLAGWIENIEKKQKKRVAKINGQIKHLTDEYHRRLALASDCIDARLEAAKQ